MWRLSLRDIKYNPKICVVLNYTLRPAARNTHKAKIRFFCPVLRSYNVLRKNLRNVKVTCKSDLLKRFSIFWPHLKSNLIAKVEI